MTDRSDLVRAIQGAQDGAALTRAVAALDAYDSQRVAQAAQDRELDLGAHFAAQRLTPVPTHELHTAATDWLADYQLPSDGAYRTAMITQASVWYSNLDRAVKADPAEFAEQARGMARTAGSAYGYQADAAQGEFLRTASYLRATDAASGLPQIDQTVDPNNNPGATPYPAEVFPTFGEEQDPFNAVETNNHASGADSDRAPMLQQLNQMDGSGSGYGSGPERQLTHDQGFDTSNSYAEVPLGQPGTIPTAPAGGAPMGSSHPNPGATLQGDMGADRRQAVASIEGYSMPDPFGYRWATTAEIVHPFHERCAAAHWPDEDCGDRTHTASVAISYAMDLDTARRLADCERIGAQEGLRAYASAQSVADLAAHHNRVTAAWGVSDRDAEDTAVLHGFMAVVRPVLADLAPVEARDFSKKKREQLTEQGDALDGKLPVQSAQDLENAKHLKGKVKGESKAKVNKYMKAKEQEFGQKAAGRHAASRLDFKQGADAAPGNLATPGNSDDDESSPEAQSMTATAASSLPQIQQVTDPNNAETPEADQLPTGVMFPIDPGFNAQWVTGPGGAQPKGGTEHEAARGQLPSRAAEMFGRMDAMDGRMPQHKDKFAYNKVQHGRYLGGWNETAGLIHGLNGRAPLSRDEYHAATGRGDLHGNYLASYANGRKLHSDPQGVYEGGIGEVTSGKAKEDPSNNRCSSCGHLPGCGCTHHCDNDPHVGGHPEHVSRTSSQHTADAWSQPKQTTDDQYPPYNSAETTPPMHQDNGDYQAGQAAGKADKAAGSRPAFADNSSGVSPYVKGYAEGYSGAARPQAPQDVPVSIGGDNGQGMNSGEAQRAFQVARASKAAPGTSRCEECTGQAESHAPWCSHRDDPDNWVHASRRTARLRRVSASFAPDDLLRDPEFRKGYLFASKWVPGRAMVTTGSAKFEAGLYAGVTDRPEIQAAWLSVHRVLGRQNAGLRRRIELHASFTRKAAMRGMWVKGPYLQRQAGTSTDLITDGPGTSPDPMGSTPLNGPGTPPPMGGMSNPARPGGPAPYQGAPPLGGGPVVPDDVMGKPQSPPQPSGPFVQTFNGMHPENVTLAPVAPNSADQPGYSNKDAYKGDPGDRVDANPRLAAFRARVQAGLAQQAQRAGRAAPGQS